MGVLFLAKVVSQTLMFLLAVVCVAGAEPIDPRQLDIKTGHPILFVNPQVVANAKNKKALLNDFVENHAKRYYVKADTLDVPLIRQHADERTVGGSHELYYISHVGLPHGLYALLTQDPIGIEYCRQILLSFIDMGIAWHGPGDGHSTGKLFAMGLFYDWIHSHLSRDIRRSVREHLLASLEFLDTEKKGYYLNPSSFTGNHAHYANLYALVALLAIRHDIVLDSKAMQDKYFYLLGKVVSNWIDGYNKTSAWLSQGGGHHMGWAYGQGYTRSEPYLAWEYATNEPSWLTNWQNDRTNFYLYGLRKLNTIRYDMYPVAGDSFGAKWLPSLSGLEVTVAASHYNNPYAEWLTKRLGTSYFAKLLYESAAWSVSTPPVTLPLARHFPNSGYVIMRDTWNFEDNDNTLMVFKSSSFYTFTHSHRDENAFTIFYKGPLAIDSGAYDAGGEYGSSHWYNYYTRSVAHNTILVYDPNENFRDHKGSIISRDGGQKVLANIDPTYEEMIEGGVHHFDGILRYENHAEYAYSMGDATKAYSSNKLSEFKRSVVYLRNHSYNHPLIVVYDRVVSTHPGFKKTYLLHSINRPKVNGKVVQIAIEDDVDPKSLGGLFQETLLPTNPVLTVIGGRANGQDFYVHDDGFGVPRNYNKGVLYDDIAPKMVKGLREAGEWRVEISPSVPRKDDTFLNVISITDNPSMHAQAVVQTVGSSNIDGLVVNDRDGMEKGLVLFQKEPGPLLEKIDLSDRNSFDTVLIVGLAPNTTFSISKSKDVLSIQNDPAGNFISSKQGTIYGDAITFEPDTTVIR